MKKYLIAIVLFLFIANIFNFSIYKTAFSVDQATCDQKAKQLGEYITTAQTNLKILYDDYNGGETDWLTGKKKNRKYWKDETSTTYPSGFKPLPLEWSSLEPWKWWQSDYYNVLDNLLKDDGKPLMKAAWDNVKKATALSDEMENLGCGDNTVVNINSYGNISTTNPTTYKNIKENIIPRMKKISGQVQDLQTTSSGMPYNSQNCQTKCEENMKTNWLKGGYCAALCLIDEAFTTFVNWSITILISAAGIS